MDMKKIILVLLAGSVLSAFSIPGAGGPVAGTVNELTGYKLRYNIIDRSDFNLWVVTNEDVFNEEFVAVNDSVLKPRFNEQMVLAAKVETLNYSYRVKFRNTVEQEGTLNVYFSVRKAGAVETTEAPVSMIMFPKVRGIRKVNFYHDNMLVKTIPVVVVY